MYTKRTKVVEIPLETTRTAAVKSAGDSYDAVMGIIAIVLFLAVGLFLWQPWNTPTVNTTTITIQPADQTPSWDEFVL